MKIITNIFNVKQDETDIQSSITTIFKISDIDLENTDVVVPEVSETFTNKTILTSTVEEGTYGNFAVKDGNIYIDNTLRASSINKGTLLKIAKSSVQASAINNAVELMDFLRTNSALLLTNEFNRTKSAVTSEGEYTEIPGIYTANFKNIRYSTKHMSVSIPYVVKGSVYNYIDGAENEVERIVSANLVDIEGNIVKKFTCIIDENTLIDLKNRITENDLLEVEDIDGIKDAENKTYIVSRGSNGSYILTVNTSNLNKYPVILNGQLNIMCNAVILRDSAFKLNSVIRLIKAYREGNNLIREALICSGHNLDGEYNIYNIEPLDSTIDNTIGAPEIEFYIQGRKVIPSFSKMVGKYLSESEIIKIAKEMIYTENFKQIKELSEYISKGLNMPDTVDITNKDDVLNKLSEKYALDLVPFTGFINSLTIESNLYSKYIENTVEIETLESLRELYKARLSYARNCIYKNMNVPIVSDDKICISILKDGVKTSL